MPSTMPGDLPEEGRQVEGAAQQGLAHGLTAGKGHLPPPEQEREARIGHDAEAARLDEQQEHGLSPPERGRR